MSACAEMQTDGDTAHAIDAEYGIKDMLNEKVPPEHVTSGRFHHDVKHLDIDLDCLTSGKINWGDAIKSLEWMVDKSKQALEDHKENLPEISQFLAKTCIMHTIQCFHHCRADSAPGFAHEGESIPSQPPSEKESRTKSDTDDHSSPQSPST